MSDEQTVFIVDDDPAVSDSLRALLESDDLTAETYSSAQAFLDSYSGARSGCLLLDVQLPDVDGLKLQQDLAAAHPALPVIIITGHADVPVAVKALKAGAVDFIEKPFADDIILESVRRGLEISRQKRREQASLQAARAGLERLTARERDVLDHLVEGHLNKVIAYELGISARTVEIHRSRVMEKMGATSLAHLVRMGLALGIGLED